MCGIAGLWAPWLDPEQREAIVARMVERLRHRGPSGRVLWSGEGVTLGLTRLAIVSPGSVAKVAANEDGRIVAVVNGEIYNHQALREALRQRGHDPTVAPDTEVIPHLYEDFGARFPEQLDGMFAAAVWDASAHRLTLARDRAGEKPLFHANQDGAWGFASEPAALLELPWLSREPAPDSLSRYLVHGFFAGEDCAFAGVRQLPAAHVLELERGAERVTRYWRPWDSLGDGSHGSATLGEAKAATLLALERAVESRVPGEVPFGVFLSGGVDSSLVAVLASRVLRRSFPTFSLRLADRGYDESGFARAVAASIGSEHHELTMDAAAGEEALELYAAGMDQPLGDPSVLPTWSLARMAAKFVPVVLTGEGGDELFAGYPTYLGHRHAGLAARIPAPVHEALLALVRRARPRHHHVTIPHMLERFLETRRLSPFERHLAWFGTATPTEARALLAPDLRDVIGVGAPLAHLTALERSLRRVRGVSLVDNPGLVAYQLLDFELYLSGDLLTKVDRCAMAHGVESRAPFLRHELIEFALALPEAAKLHGGTGKWALKQAAKGLLPDALLARRKQGFSPPFSAWARGPLREAVRARLAPERVEAAGVLDRHAVSRLLDDHIENRTERGRTLWTLLSLQMWAERWLKGALPAPPAHAKPPEIAAVEA